MKKHHGFTLIELMIAVAIVGILVSVALPSYNRYVLRSHRVDAINGLLDAASRQARYYTMNNSYTNAMNALGYPVDSAGNYQVPSSTTTYYNVTVQSKTDATSTTPATFTVQAVPSGTQASDACGTFTLTDLGVRGVSASTVASCWGQ